MVCTQWEVSCDTGVNLNGADDVGERDDKVCRVRLLELLSKIFEQELGSMGIYGDRGRRSSVIHFLERAFLRHTTTCIFFHCRKRLWVGAGHVDMVS